MTTTCRIVDCLKWDLVILKIFGFYWDGGHLTYGKFIYSILVTFAFYVISFAQILNGNPRNLRKENTIDGLVLNALFNFRNSINCLYHCFAILALMFYKRKSRCEFFKILKNFEVIDCVGESAKRFLNGLTLFGIIYVLIINSVIRVYINLDLVSFIYIINLLTLNLQFFVFYEIQVVFIKLIFATHYCVKVVNFGTLNDIQFNRKTFEIFKLTKLFNESFGLVIMIDIVKSFLFSLVAVYFILQRMITSNEIFDSGNLQSAIFNIHGFLALAILFEAFQIFGDEVRN